MKRIYKCDFCDACFTNETEAIAHEDKCGRNPKNKINDKTVFSPRYDFPQFASNNCLCFT